MDFLTGEELLARCEDSGLPISGVMKRRETDNTEQSKEIVDARLKKALEIMKNSAHGPLLHPQKSMGGLIGGEAKRLAAHAESAGCAVDTLLGKAIRYSMAVLEVNASMGTIVAAPTAGSSGVVPGVLFALQEERGLSEAELEKGLLCAGAVGCLLMLNSSVSGAEAGCQAEIGSASAMAAAAAVELMGGSSKMCLEAASLALSNLLGLVCDPIAGLVESPCQSRNAMGAANALTCAELALSGICHPIPFDEMASMMHHVGRSLPMELRETALGGCAATPTGQRLGETLKRPQCAGCK